MTVSAYTYDVLAYLCVHVSMCMYRLEYMYQCIRINPTESAKNVRTKCILRANMCIVVRGWDLAELFRVSDCQCRSRNSPGFDPSILRHIGIWRAADEAVLNKVHFKKSPFLFKYVYRCVSAYKCMLVQAYLCVYVSAWIYVQYQCIRINPAVIGKNFIWKETSWIEIMRKKCFLKGNEIFEAKKGFPFVSLRSENN